MAKNLMLVMAGALVDGGLILIILSAASCP
jgi:hypothetical protein